MNAPWNAPISDRFSSLCARVFSPAAAILESKKTLGTRLTSSEVHFSPLTRVLPLRVNRSLGALSIRPKIPEIPGLGANGTDIFRNFIPKFWVYLARLA